MKLFKNYLDQGSPPRRVTVKELLIPNEQIETTCREPRDPIFFTTKRLIYVTRGIVKGREYTNEITSLPYNCISRFALEEVSDVASDIEIRIWVSGVSSPVTLDFREDEDPEETYRTLALYTLR